MPRNRKIETRRVKGSELIPNPVNWRLHPPTQRDHLGSVLEAVGDVDYLKVVETDDGLMLVDGHLRADLAGDDEVDVVVLDLTPDEQALVLATFDPLAMMAQADADTLRALTDDMVMGEDMVRDIFASLSQTSDALAGILGGMNGADVGPRAADLIQTDHESARDLPVDAVYTTFYQPMCCLAAIIGMKYGISSVNVALETMDKRICPNLTRFKGNHRITFIDNEYAEYDHDHHLAVIKALRPKYATVRDIMTRKQCKEAGIPFYTFPKIMKWAEELSEYADNVIVIPKYDCLDKIPDEYVLGYSIPTSHGGTPLELERFRGRRVHLLGGSWTWQRNALMQLGDDVVALDNNYLNRQATFGGIILPDGTNTDIDSMEFGEWITSPRVVATMLSFNAIAYEINRILKGTDDEQRQPISAESEIFGEQGDDAG